MKRVGRWTWMLLTLLLLLCGTVLAAAPERTSIELEQPIEMTFEEDGYSAIRSQHRLTVCVCRLNG